MKRTNFIFACLILCSVLQLPTRSYAQDNIDSSEKELQGILDAFENDQSESVEGKKVDLKSLQFETGTDRLTSTDKAYLDKIIDYFKSLPTALLTIEGHSDNVGNLKNNQVLSENRAKSVKTYLVEIGASPDRLKTEGFGSSKPIASNDTDAGRKQNRRVELKFSGVTDETHTINLENGTQVTAQFIMINKDGSIGYKETLKSPMKKLKAPEIRSIQFHNGSTLIPKDDPLVKKKIDQWENALRERPAAKEPEPVAPPTPLGKQTEKASNLKSIQFIYGVGVYPINVKNDASLSAVYGNSTGSLAAVSKDIKKQSIGYGGLIGLEWTYLKHVYARAAFQYALNSEADRILWTFGLGKTLGRSKRFNVGIDFSTGYVQTRVGEPANKGITINSVAFKSEKITVIARNSFLTFTPNVSYDFPTKNRGVFRLQAGFSSSLLRSLRVKFKGQGDDNSTFKNLSDSELNFKVNGVRTTDSQLFDINGVHFSIIYMSKR
ncbi:MAG: OmpA family protein [Cyclobacteriaceae bacterium]